MSFYTIQTGFSRGEIAPQFVDRQDFSGWNYALKEARNVWITASAIEIRAGSRFIETVGTADKNYQIAKLQFTSTDIFYAVFSEFQIEIYEFSGNVSVQTIATNITDEEILQLKTVFFSLALVITIDERMPQTLTYDATQLVGNQFSIQDYTFTVPPSYDFDPSAYSDSTFLLNNRKVGQNGTLSVTAGSFVFDDSFVGGQLTAVGSDQINFAGTARITSFVSQTEVDVYISSTIGDDQASNPITLQGADIVLTSQAFSTERGYPKLVGGFQNRVLFCSTPALPTAAFASVTGIPQSFDTGTGIDTDAIVFTINEDDVSEVIHVVNNQTIQFVTNNGLYVFNTAYVGGLTPSNVNLVGTNKFAYSTVMQPIVYDSMTIGLLEGGKTLIGTQYEGSDQYTSNQINTMATHLLNFPTDAATFDGQIESLSTMAFFVNSDGTLCQYQSLKSEDINGFSLSTTGENGEDKYRNVMNIDDKLYYLIERNGNVLLEVMDFDQRLDCVSIKKSAGDEGFTNIAGLDHLEGRTLMALVSGITENNGTIEINEEDGFLTVTDLLVVNGEVTLPYPVKIAKVGIFFAPRVTPLEPLIPMNPVTGSMFYQRKKRYEVKVSFYQSIGIEIENSEGVIWKQPTLDFEEAAFFPPKLTTDVAQFPLGGGWSNQLPSFTITQSLPYSFTIKGTTQFINIEDEV